MKYLSDVLLIGVCSAILWHFSNIVRYGAHLIQEPDQVVLWGEITFFVLVILGSIYSIWRKMSMIAQGDIHDNDFSSAFYKGKRAGIKEVVDSVEEYCSIVKKEDGLIAIPSVWDITEIKIWWQSKLKEWGIDA
ncbi:hypothetical protein LCGC14_1505300 [marine sediment metagenome]|uniref:Uncharacterized protein n=2 Tax=marine sediment metagenome TaxID=412755 RepID=A0A0F9LI74_9ZZZZ